MSYFDLDGFNQLPWPDLSALGQAKSPEAQEQSLRNALPFLFKPTRALALLDPSFEVENAGNAGDEPKSRWVIRLDYHPSLRHYPQTIAVFTRGGRFSVWVYQKDHFFPLYLTAKNTRRKAPETPSYWVELRKQEIDSLEPSLREETLTFNLLHFVQQGDSDGGIFLRIFTSQTEHQLQLDFGTIFDTPEANVFDALANHSLFYVHTAISIREHTLPTQVPWRQIGGWGESPAFFRPEAHSGELFQGTLLKHKELRLPDGFPVETKLWAVTEKDGFRVLGGNTDALWVHETHAGTPANVHSNKTLHGNIRTLELLPSKFHDDDTPLIIAGCDDYHLYVYDHQGKELAAINMEGAVEAIVLLGAVPQKYFDLVVLVRNKGVLGVRLFYEQLRFQKDDIQPYRQDFFKALWNVVAHRDGADCIRHWLEARDAYSQLLGLLAILDRPTLEHIDLISPKKLRSYTLESQIINAFILRLLKCLSDLLDTNSISSQDLLTSPLSAYLQILAHLAEGPYHTRMALCQHRSLWQNLRNHSLLKNSAYFEYLSKLYAALPGIKHQMLCFAKEARQKEREQDIQGAEEAVLNLLALQQLLHFYRVYPEAVFRAPDASANRIDGLHLVPGHPPQLVFSQRRSHPLRALPLEESKPFTEPELEMSAWQPDWPDEPLVEAVLIRAILPVPGDDRLLLLRPHKLEMIRINEQQPETLPVADQSQQPFWSAAFSVDGQFLAVAGEWHYHDKAETPPVLLWQRSSSGRWEPQDSPIQASDDWHEYRLRITALAWDKQGHLWAATGGKGKVFCWRHARGAPKLMATTGSPQNALQLLDTPNGTLTLCGGQNGVVRAFDAEGRLRWANVLRGSIQSLTVLPRNEETRKHHAELAVLTDAQHFFLYDAEGFQRGILHMDGQLFYSLASTEVGNIPYHALGTLDGEILLLAELPQEQEDAEMLDHVLGNSTLSESTVKIVQGYRQKIIRNPTLLKKYCHIQTALQEPLRTAWAARQLLNEHGEFEPVIHLLLEIQYRFDTVSRNLRAHLMGALGKHFDKLPEKYHRDFIDLCRKIRDGALASLLNTMPEKIEINNDLLPKVLHVAKTKIFLGRQYVSGVLLQRLRCAPLEHSRRTEQLICELLRRPANSLWHPGILEGALAVLWNSLGLADKGLFASLSALPAQYPKLAKELHKPERRRLFCDWLNRYGSTLFSTDESCFWRWFAELVEPAEALDKSKLETLPVRLRNALQERGRQKAHKYPEREAFEALLGLFPQEDHEYDITKLPDEWHKIVLKTQLLLNILDRVVHQVMPAKESRKLLQTGLNELSRPIIQSPLLDNLELAWQHAWQQTLQHRFDNIEADGPTAWTGKIPALQEVLERLNKVMDSLGFMHGRLFYVVEVPGSDSSEILRTHDENGPTNEIYSISKETATYLDRYTSYTKPMHFLFKTHPPADQDPQDLGVRFWEQIPSSMPGVIRVDMPLLKKRAYRVHQGVYRPNAMLLFEWRHGHSRQDFSRAHQTLSDERQHLLPIVSQIRAALNAMRQARKQQIDTILDAFSQKLRYTLHSGAIEKALVETAHQLTGADSTTLLRPNEEQDALRVCSSYGDNINEYRNSEFCVEDTFLPVTKCWQSGKAVFNPDWKHSESYANLLKYIKKGGHHPMQRYAQMHAFWANIGSAAVLPIHLGKQIIGVLRIHSSKPYAFDANCISSLEILFDRASWFLYAIQSEEQQDRERYVWARTIMHELRSELIPLNAHLKAILENPTQVKNIQRATFGLATAQHLLDLTNNFMVIDGININDDQIICENPGHTVQEFLSLHQENISSAEEHIIVTPPNSDPVWQKNLRGHPEIFARVIRNLLHNAVKYSAETEQAVIKVNARSSGRYWELMISNPGQMTEEQDRYKFDHIPPQIPDGSGAHVGLAASLKWTKFYGGELKVSNITDSDGPRVLAHLRWPLVN